MDFFAHQDRARRRTTLLIAYFVAAVFLIVAAINLGVAFALGYAAGEDPRPRRLEVERPAFAATRTGPFVWNGAVVAWTSALTVLVISSGTFFRWLSLRGGGPAIAQMAGGRAVAPGTRDPACRRLLNIVEEMSIASGVPMPAVYVLEEEPGINAFAAGYTPSDAAIAVTRGAVDKLSRDELQGVIAHEYSHILNGDMRLNVRLIAVLYGILMIAMLGRGLLRSLRYAGSRRGKNNGAVVIIVIGLVLLLVGYIGYFFGRLIQAAVSRQREFLADAAAVQFTRNPVGVGGALKKIGAYALGSAVISEEATPIRHLFFAQAFRDDGFSFLATHPPLAERIRAIEPRWDGRFPEITAAAVAGFEPSDAVSPSPAFEPPPLPARPVATAVLLAAIGTTSAEHLNRARTLLGSIDPALRSAAHDPARAWHVVLSLLLARDPGTRARQLEIVRLRHGVPVGQAFADFAPLAEQLDPALRLPLLNLTLPALRTLPPPDTEGLLATAGEMIAADGEVTLFEFMIQKALDRHVAAPARGVRPGVVNFYSFGALRTEIELLLSTLSRIGADSPDEAAQAFAAAAGRVPPLAGQIQLLPPDACSLAGIGAALDRLVQASPAIRKVVLAAGCEAAASDGTLEPDEADLLRAIADALDCPIPPLINAGAA